MFGSSTLSRFRNIQDTILRFYRVEPTTIPGSSGYYAVSSSLIYSSRRTSARVLSANDALHFPNPFPASPTLYLSCRISTTPIHSLQPAIGTFSKYSSHLLVPRSYFFTKQLVSLYKLCAKQKSGAVQRLFHTVLVRRAH